MAWVSATLHWWGSTKPKQPQCCLQLHIFFLPLRSDGHGYLNFPPFFSSSLFSSSSFSPFYFSPSFPPFPPSWGTVSPRLCAGTWVYMVLIMSWIQVHRWCLHPIMKLIATLVIELYHCKPVNYYFTLFCCMNTYEVYEFMMSHRFFKISDDDGHWIPIYLRAKPDQQHRIACVHRTNERINSSTFKSLHVTECITMHVRPV